MMTEVMLDLETLGTGADAVILSIGAVKFDPRDRATPFDCFHVALDPASQAGYGRKIDGKTVLWWMEPERAEAREALLGMERMDMAAALDGFRMWMDGEKPVWGNGATFDNAILRSAYAAIHMECPWSFWNDRCYRTVKNLTNVPVFVRSGTYHNALDDALSQARHLQSIFAFNIVAPVEA